MRNSLYIETKHNLLKLINNLNLKKNNQLPSEDSLAEQLNVSRSTIREVLRTLDKEGIISKKHGFGNFIHASALNTVMRIDQIQDFINLIEDGNHQASFKLLNNEFIKADDKIKKFLKLEDDELVLVRKGLYYADNNPAIYCEIFIPQRLFLIQPDLKQVGRSIFKFLKKYCNQEVAQTLIYFQAAISDEVLANYLDVPLLCPLFAWEEVYFNFKDEAICSAKCYFKPEIMKLTMLRKTDGPLD
ncbi:MAG TPA: GntR family transcriptional regulator [Clostridia bacterium]|nr:GntR family transcriptional regulator [Clostridia bacterium]